MMKRAIVVILACILLISACVALAATPEQQTQKAQPKAGLYVQTPVVAAGVRCFAYENNETLGWAWDGEGEGNLCFLDVGLTAYLSTMDKQPLPYKIYPKNSLNLGIGQGFVCFTANLKQGSLFFFPVVKDGKVLDFLIFERKGNAISNMLSADCPDPHLNGSIQGFLDAVRKAGISDANPLFFYEIGGVCAISKDSSFVYVLSTKKGKTEDQVKQLALKAHAKRIKNGKSAQKEELIHLSDLIEYDKAYEPLRVNASAAVNKKALSIAQAAGWPEDGMTFSHVPEQEFGEVRYTAQRIMHVEGYAEPVTLTYFIRARNAYTTNLTEFTVGASINNGGHAWTCETPQDVKEELDRLRGLGLLQ